MSAPSSNNKQTKRPINSCINCASRKVKCDRNYPCNTCSKRHAECVYHPSQPPRKKCARVKELTERLRHCEERLRVVTTTPVESRLQISPLTVPEQTVKVTQIVQDNECTRVVDNSLWRRIAEELDNSIHAFDASDEQLDFVLGHCSKDPLQRPCFEHGQKLFQIFIDRIDPLTKIVHIPALRLALLKPSLTNDALVFAVYTAATLSLTNDECQTTLGSPRSVLLSRYVSATKSALSQARFMSTNSLVVLQALVIHLITIRDVMDSRSVWSLTGVAVRVAQAMGLDRDGTLLSLSPFETELRRRIWWLLRTHDFRTAELCGLPKYRELRLDPDSTYGPTNIDDDQLQPDMEELVGTTDKITQASFVVFRHELLKFAADQIVRLRDQGKTLSQWELHATNAFMDDIDKAIDDLEQLLETRYIRYCDPCQPLHLLVMLTARFAVNSARFLTHHPRRWKSGVSAAEQQFVWDLTIQLLEQYHMVQTNPSLQRFAWHAAYFQQWHALIHALDTLKGSPDVMHADKVWQLIASVYTNNPDMINDMRKPIYVAVGRLAVKAWDVKGADSELEFLTRLRWRLDNTQPRHTRRGEQTVESRYFNDNSLEIDMPLDVDLALDWQQWDDWLVESSLLQPLQ